MYKRSTAFLYFTFRPERKSWEIFVQICLNKEHENCFLMVLLKYSLYLRNDMYWSIYIVFSLNAKCFYKELNTHRVYIERKQ